MLMEGRLYVGGLNLSTTKQDIDREFGKFGSLRDVWLARNPPGFAFIEYFNTSDAEQAMRDLDGHNFLGSHIRVEPSKGKGRQDGGGGGMRGGDRGGRRGGSGGGFRGGSPRGGSAMRPSRGGRGDGPGAPRGSRGPPGSYSSYSDYSSRGGSGSAGYRDEPRSRYSGDAYGSSRYESAPYRSRSPIRRRSPLPTTRGRDFGSREFGAASRDYGSSGRDYASGRAYASAVPDYASPSREYSSARSYPPREDSRDYRTAAVSGGASGRYDRSDFERYPRYERTQASSYSERSRRSPPPRR